MEDLLLLESTGDYLILETQGGSRFRILVDEPLRRALRPSPNKPSSEPVSPREIQDSVRLGETVEQLCARTGLDEDYVLKFAQPVLDEIEHVIEMAQATRITLEADRFGEQRVVELRELISERTESAQVWVAHKLDGPGWIIELNLADIDEPAKWHFDLRKLILTPESVLAAKLSAAKTAESVLGGLIPTAPSPRENTNIVPLTPKAFRVDEGDSKQEPKQPLFEAKDSFLENKDENVLTKAEENGIESVPVSQPAPLSETADLLEALRRKRDVAKDTSTSQINLIAEDASSADDSTAKDGASENIELPSETSTTIKKGRASIPSWDQIVFGTKVEDTD